MAFSAFFARLWSDGLESATIDAVLEGSNEDLGALNAEGYVVDAARFFSLARKYAIEAEDILGLAGCGFWNSFEFKRRGLVVVVEW